MTEIEQADAVGRFQGPETRFVISVFIAGVSGTSHFCKRQQEGVKRLLV
jgi:hypothetical protein